MNGWLGQVRKSRTMDTGRGAKWLACLYCPPSLQVRGVGGCLRHPLRQEPSRPQVALTAHLHTDTTQSSSSRPTHGAIKEIFSINT